MIALDRTLYRLESKEIGRQFLILLISPFFRIKRMVADLKVSVKVPFLKQQLAYIGRGKYGARGKFGASAELK